MNYASEVSSSEVSSVADIYVRHPLLDLEQLDEVIEGIVQANSMLSVVVALGYSQYSRELLALLRDRVGRFVEALAVEGSYVPGVASLLASRISKRLWELDLSDEELGAFLSLLANYRAALVDGNLDSEDALEMLRLTCFYLQVTRCEELEAYLRPLTPLTALQVALTGLVASAGGLGV